MKREGERISGKNDGAVNSGGLGLKWKLNLKNNK